MKKFEQLTQTLRDTDIFGLKPKKHVLLYNDSCSSHANDAQIEKLKKKKINERRGVPDGTHIWQAVDQNVGVFMQTDIQEQYFDFAEEILDEVDEGTRDESDKVGAKQMREKIVEFAFNSAKKLSQKKHLLESAWTNFGIDLPLDGSKDGDIKTIKH